MATAIAARPSATRSDMAHDYLVCLSLANLHFLNAWLEVGNVGFDFFRGTRPSATAIWATLTLVGLLSLVFWGLMQLWRHAPQAVRRPLAVVGLGLSLLVPLNIVHRNLLDGVVDAAADAVGRAAVMAGAIVIGAALFAWLLLRTGSAARAYASVLMFVLPLGPILALQGIWTQTQRPSDAAYAGAVAEQPPTARPTRVVVMVFDEWDYRLAIGERPARVRLPALDRFRAQAFSASQAVGGGYLGVYRSLASMLSGRRVRYDDPRSIGFEGDGTRRRVVDRAAEWSDGPHLFSELKRRGWSSSVVGWYLPYCRLVGDYLDACWWQPGGSVYGRAELVSELSFASTLEELAERQLERVPFSDDLDLGDMEDDRRDLLAEEVERIRAHAAGALDKTDLLYVHWPLPHPFGLPATAPDGTRIETNYLDNLEVVDRLLDEFESGARARGRWDDLTVVLTADHSLRPSYWRRTNAWTDEEEQASGGRQSPYVPFLIKFPGGQAPLVYDQPFTIALTRDVVLAIADGTVRSPDELAAWLDRNRTSHPTDLRAAANRSSTAAEP